MKAVTYHGKRDVRVDNVPDPTIEEPTDAIVRITSSGICGSDLHLYEVLGAFMDEGDILGHEPMGIVEEVGAEVTHIKPGDRVVIPFNISCGHCFMCDQGLYSQCETTQVREQGKGAALLGYTKLYGQVPGGQAEYLRVPQAQFGPIKVPERVRPTSASSTSPTCCPPPGRRSSTRRFPRAARWPCSGSARSARCAARIALHRGAGEVVGIDLVAERLEHGQRARHPHHRRARARRHRRDAARAHRRPRPRLGDRRGRHGGARRAVRQARPAAGRLPARRDRREGDRKGRDRPCSACSTPRSTPCAAAGRSP